MTKLTFKEEVKDCEREGLSQYAKNKTFQQFWDECERGDFMFAVYSRMFPDNARERVLAAGYCAATVLYLMED